METKERVRANGTVLSRRCLLAAAPALALAGAAPAAAAPSETPVMAAFRAWKAHNDWLNSGATDHQSDEEFNTLCNDDMKLIDAIFSEPARDLADLCLKLLAVTDFGAFIYYDGVPGADRLPDEARALIGV